MLDAFPRILTARKTGHLIILTTTLEAGVQIADIVERFAFVDDDRARSASADMFDSFNKTLVSLIDSLPRGESNEGEYQNCGTLHGWDSADGTLSSLPFKGADAQQHLVKCAAHQHSVL